MTLNKKQTNNDLMVIDQHGPCYVTDRSVEPCVHPSLHHILFWGSTSSRYSISTFVPDRHHTATAGMTARWLIILLLSVNHSNCCMTFRIQFCNKAEDPPLPRPHLIYAVHKVQVSPVAFYSTSLQKHHSGFGFQRNEDGVQKVLFESDLVALNHFDETYIQLNKYSIMRL